MTARRRANRPRETGETLEDVARMIRRPMKTAALVASIASIMSAVGTGSARSQGTAAEATPEFTSESTEWAPLVVDTHAQVWNAQDLAACPRLR